MRIDLLDTAPCSFRRQTISARRCIGIYIVGSAAHGRHGMLIIGIILVHYQIILGRTGDLDTLNGIGCIPAG